MNGRMVTARKVHACNLCPFPIPAGTRCWSERLTPWDHPDNEGYGSYRAHPLCHEVMCSVAAEWEECQLTDHVWFEHTWPDRCHPDVYWDDSDGTGHEASVVGTVVTCVCGRAIDLAETRGAA